MYELWVACRYLRPRLREISVSIISLISVFVIALVVWLIIVFFSATEGLEKKWTERLVAITAPIRLIPTKAYYQSYYYEIDSFSHASQFRPKTFAEKLATKTTDPYNPSEDPPLPLGFPPKERTDTNQEIDILKKAASICQAIPHVHVFPFETSFANIKLRIIRENSEGHQTQELITQPSYIINWDARNTQLRDALQPLSEEDIDHIRQLGLEPALFKDVFTLKLPRLGEPILLPKGFKEAGAEVGDTGNLHYQLATPSGVSDLKTPVFVAGFYDPGIIPIGGKIILASDMLVSEIRGLGYADMKLLPAGLNVQFKDFSRKDFVKRKIIEGLQKASILPYFDVEAYDEYEFTRDIFSQLKSERNLFSLISIIIIVVACSNIVSMLIILVHDKSKEIAILRALGATKKSIGLIFGISGLCMGAFGSLVGSICAYFTVKNLPLLLKGLGKLQGFDVLNTAFFGEEIPTELSHSTFLYVVGMAAVISMIAALIPAIKASRQNTQDALRSE